MRTQVNTIFRNEDSVPGMSARNWPARFARFGAFSIDLQREELFRDGRRVRVQTKIYQALLVLLGRPGEIVSREEVSKSLWPETSRVNLDANVNTTINKLRAMLGDSSEKPVYIETVPRRGYIFSATVEFHEERPSAAPNAHAGAKETQQVARQGAKENWFFSHLNTEPTPLRIATLVLVGMIMGALLVLAWNFVSDRQQSRNDLGRTNAIVLHSSRYSYNEI